MTGLTKIYFVIGGIVLLALGGYTWLVYNKGGDDREAKILVAYATAKPKVDTVRTVEYVDRPVYQERKIPVFIPDPRADSLIALSADKDSLIRTLSSKASATFTGPELGTLTVDYVPLDRYFAVDHQPPPAKIERVTVTIEKPVLVRENFWGKVDEYLIAAAIGGAIMWIVE